MNAYRLLILSVAALAVPALTQAQAQDPGRAAVERADEVVRSLQEAQITDPTVFVKSAALGGMTEMELAKLAQAKSPNDAVRRFAARVLEDHQAIHAQLAAICKGKRLDVPTTLDYEDEQLVMQAAEKSDAGFDAWYLREMITEYQDAVGLYQAAAKMEDAELSAFAKKALPTLDDHQRMAVALVSAPQP
jgi:putative membrane protein